jgi:hypothetical protein
VHISPLTVVFFDSNKKLDSRSTIRQDRNPGRVSNFKLRKSMSRQWLTLMAILLVYIPVAIDATVLHVAAPTLSVRWGPAAMSCCGSLIFIH